MNEYLTTDFVVVREGEQTPPGGVPGRIQCWVDWVPRVDGDVGQAVRAKREGEDLLVWVNELTGAGEPRPVRRLVGLNAEAREHLGSGFVWVVCGPSGVLSERLVALK